MLPALSKAWQIVPNMPQFNVSSVGGGPVLLDRKRALCGVSFSGYSISANAWRVIRSSNGTTVADSDLWLTTADMVNGNAAGTTPHAWIILENVMGRQMLIDYYGSTSRDCHVSMSPSGSFSGGTTTTKATAPDELDHYSFVAPIATTGTDNQHVWVSADGRQTIMVTCAAGSSFSLWMIGEAEDAPAAWANPCVLYTAGCGDTGAPTSCVGRQMIGFSAGHPFSGEALPGVNGTIRCITESVTTAAVPLMISSSSINLRNELSSTWDWYRINQFQGEHADLWGPLGYWPDMYATVPPRTGAPALRTGDHFPGTGRTWVKVDDLILPWQGGPAMVVG